MIEQIKDHKNLFPFILIILDGWGLAPAWGGNAIEMAETPSIDTLWRDFPHAELQAAEEAVGLPRDEPGNSEIGHLNIGSGRVVHEGLSLINKCITSGEFEKNPVFGRTIQHIKKNRSNLHIMGLAGEGGIHSHINHLYALLKTLKKMGVDKTYLHLFTDGRDSPPMEALSTFAKIKKNIGLIGLGTISSISGRFYAMDRDHRWDRIEKTYFALTKKRALIAAGPEKGIAASYRQRITDEFIAPFIIETDAKRFKPIRDNDAVIFVNFRPDRARELTSAFTADNFSHFDRGKKIKNLYFVTFTDYGEHLPVEIAFGVKDIKNPLAEIIAGEGLKQFHIAETEKYAHVTYFFNGGREYPFSGETRVLIPSPKVSTYDLKPEMSALEITNQLTRKLKKRGPDFTVVNYANPDMVGHTGNLKATIRACETVDKQTGQLIKKILQLKGTAIVIADHGNAEKMIEPGNGQPHTEHTTAPVPFILINDILRKQKIPFRSDGKLADVAPTILGLMGLKMPEEMEGRSLFLST